MDPIEPDLRLGKLPTQSSFIELTLDEVEEFKNKVMEQLVQGIESEKEFMSEQNSVPTEVIDEFAKFHTDLLNTLKDFLKDELSDEEIRALLNVEFVENDEKTTVGEWFNEFQERLRSAIEENGYELTEEDKEAMGAALAKGLNYLFNEYHSNSNSLEREVEILKEQNISLRKEIETLSGSVKSLAARVLKLEGGADSDKDSVEVSSDDDMDDIPETE